ncbi:hypothetical protein [Pseudomonas sp. H3_G09]
MRVRAAASNTHVVRMLTSGTDADVVCVVALVVSAHGPAIGVFIGHVV